MIRRGSVLLEILLAIVLFAGATAFTIAALRGALASTERSAVKLRAADLARSTISELEAGVLIAERGGDSESLRDVVDPDGLRVQTKTTPSAFPGLSLCEVTVYGRGDDGDERILFELRQLVPDSAAAHGAAP